MTICVITDKKKFFFLFDDGIVAEIFQSHLDNNEPNIQCLQPLTHAVMAVGETRIAQTLKIPLGLIGFFLLFRSKHLFTSILCNKNAKQVTTDWKLFNIFSPVHSFK